MIPHHEVPPHGCNLLAAKLIQAYSYPEPCIPSYSKFPGKDQLTNQRKIMKQFCTILLLMVAFIPKTEAQVTVTNPTNTTPNLAATYTSLANAITALNAITAISGPVTITLNAGNPQTAPVGGYAIQFATISNTAASPITFEGSGNTITAFTPQVSGQLYDGIFKLIGADYITIQNFVLQENSSNTTFTAATNNMTEWAIALLYKSTTDGAQNNTIQNNSISLNRNYQNSFGIYSNVRHSATNVGTTADITNNTTGPNNNNKVYGNTISNVNMGISFVGAGNAANMDTGNDIGGSSAVTGNTITNWGGATIGISNFLGNSGVFHGVFMNHQVNDNVSYNTITSATISGTTTSVRGIHNRYASAAPTGTFTVTISNNTVSVTNNNVSGNNESILSEQITTLTTATVNITGNTIINCSTTTLGIIGISNTSACGVLNISNNIFKNNTSSATAAGFTAISNTGAITTTLNIDNNQIGNASGDAINFSASTSGSVIGVLASASATAAVSISNNDFRGFTHTVAGTGSHTYITLTHAPSGATTDNINSNTFTNINANTSGNVTFITRTGAMAVSAGATENCNNNSIVTGFTKAAGGTVYLYTTTSTCLSGNTMNATGNNFSNITLPGATTIGGWNNIEGGVSGPAKNISNNIFNNWSCGSGGVAVIQSNNGGDNTIISGNNIQNISGSSFITAITQGAANKGTLQTISNNIIANINSTGNTTLGISGGSTTTTTLTISGNTISGITSAGANQSEGIKVTASGTTTNISKNKVFDISCNNAACLVLGIEINVVTASATYNITNNYVGNLTAGITNHPLAIRGISVASTAANATFNIYYNTVYINASSSGTDFGTAALFLVGNGTATTGNAIIRNNIFVNISTPNGAGVTAVYRRSTTALTNYSTTSNNNILYAGAPSSTRLICYDATNSDITLVAFKARMGATRESNSLTELPPFLSTVGSSSNFLHIDPSVPTQVESGAVNITGYTDDYDGNIRQGNAGYTGTGTAPDIGADETEATYVEHDVPVITYTSITTPSCTYSGMTITGVNITDATGIPLAGANVPRIYYKKNSGSWFSQPGTNTGGSATNSTWSFTIVESDMGGVSGGDIVYYYIVAQDITYITNTGSNPSTVAATGVNSIITAPTTPNSYTLKYTLGGTYTVGAGGNFTTLTAAVSAYNNACALTSAVVFELIDNAYGSETFPITINNHPDASATKTLTIRPSATATPTISGTSSTATFSLDGAKYVRFDGRQGGIGTPKSLTITTTSTGVTINIVNDAQNNIINYCNIKGQRASSFSGTIFIGAASTGTGNDNNTIDNNDIGEAGSFSANGICSNGTSGKENENIVITNNNIYNYYTGTGNDSHGIYAISNCSGWTISGNRFYQTATRLYTGTGTHFGIYITSGSGYTISNNVVGFANASGTGTTNMIGNSITLAGFPSSYAASGTPVAIRYVGIGVSLALFGSTSNIDGNTVGGIAMYTSSNASTIFGMLGGIYVESGTVNVGANAANIIGATSGSNSIYVATSGAGGTVFGIRSTSIISSAIQNNTIGAITVSGTNTSVAGSFTGISFAGNCNYTVSGNNIGNTSADNIQVGYMLSAGALSNAGTLSGLNAGVTSTIKGITSGSSGATLVITGNTLRGWNTSCALTSVTGIETSGTLTGGNPSADINNNSLGTASRNWVNAADNIISYLYGININNQGATVVNIKNNDIRGTLFGSQSCIGGTFIKLAGATASGAVATISGNTYTNISMSVTSGYTGLLYFIGVGYAIPSNGQLIIDNNSTVGNFNVTAGTAEYHMIHTVMASTAGAIVNITNNNFSNILTSTFNYSYFYGLYSDFTGGSCQMTVTGNTFDNWLGGNGSIIGIDLANMTGTATCSNNTVSNFLSFGSVGGIVVEPNSNSGTFNVSGNTLTALGMNGNAGGALNGISVFMPSLSTTAQINITQNNINNLYFSNLNCTASGIYFFEGDVSATATVSANKIYNLFGTASDSRVYGINNYSNLIGNITYTNNYIGDLRAPNSNIGDPGVAGMKIFHLGGQSNIYYNTIHLNAIAGAASFSTAAIVLDEATQVSMRNNILSNTSTHGAAGRTVAYWRSGTSQAAYSASSNNNLFYTGITSPLDLIFFDGINSDQTLAGYQTRVSPVDDQSINVAPNFISTTGSNVNFLHIASSGNCGINAKGNNQGILLTADYDNDIRSTSSPYITDIGADEFSLKNNWTGTNSTNWNDAGNWSTATVPNASDVNVTISSGPVNQPVIASGDTYQVASIIVGSGATLTNLGTLQVAGAIYTSTAGAVNNIQAGVVTGSIEMNGNCVTAQKIAGNVFADNSVKDFIVSNDVTVSAITGEHLNVAGELGFGSASNKTITTNDNLTLLSTATATANVGKIQNNNIISGKVSVERYINTGIGGGQHGKGWQFLATPAKGQSVYNAWQEAGATPVGYGTIITGTGSGFDITTAQPSMKFFDPTVGAAGNWVGITNTANEINDKRGYMVFVRGDRSITSPSSSANTTNLRIKGTLYQPNDPPPSTTVPAGKFTSIGNPYASAIDLNYMKNNGNFVNLDNDAVVWDPLMVGSFNFGGYQTLAAANNYVPTAGGTSFYPTAVPSPYIQSGQAFFVRSSGVAGSVSFDENCKASGSRLVNRSSEITDKQFFRVSLYTNTGIVADGNAVVFSGSYRNSVDEDDATKLLNSGENFGVIREGKLLAVEARKHPGRSDTVFYSMSNLRKQAYQFRFAPENMQRSLKAVLVDQYLHTQTIINLSAFSTIDFVVNDNPASSASDRFYVVFSQRRAVEPVIITLRAESSQQQSVQLNWEFSNKYQVTNYVVERSNDGKSFAKATSLSAEAGKQISTSGAYNDVIAITSNIYYRIKAVTTENETVYSNIAALKAPVTIPEINVYPNPVVNKKIDLHFKSMPEGLYKVAVINYAGQAVYQGQINMNGKTSMEAIQLSGNIVAGTYLLTITDAANNRKSITVFVK